MRELGVSEPKGHFGAAGLRHASCAETRDELGGDGFSVDAGAGDAALEHGEEFLFADTDEAVGAEVVHDREVFGHEADAEDEADVEGCGCETLGAAVGGEGVLIGVSFIIVLGFCEW